MVPEVLSRLAGAAVLLLQPADDGIKFFSLKDPNPEPSLAWFVLNAFFLVAVVLLVTIGISIALGSFRLWLLERFPNNPINGAPMDDPALTFRLTDHLPAPPSTSETPPSTADPGTAAGSEGQFTSSAPAPAPAPATRLRGGR